MIVPFQLPQMSKIAANPGSLPPSHIIYLSDISGTRKGLGVDCACFEPLFHPAYRPVLAPASLSMSPQSIAHIAQPMCFHCGLLLMTTTHANAIVPHLLTIEEFVLERRFRALWNMCSCRWSRKLDALPPTPNLEFYLLQ